MPIVYPSQFRAVLEDPHSQGAFVEFWLIELQRRTKVLPAVHLPITSRLVQTTWAGQTWYPFSFARGVIEESKENNHPSIELSVDNTSRLMMPYLHAGEGFEGNQATLYITHTEVLGLSWPHSNYRSWDFRIADGLATDRAIALRLEDPNYFQLRVPTDRYSPRRCRREFGGPECGYPITAVAAYTTCNRLLQDCIARGLDEAARRLPVLHPLRFGGFPGVASQRGQ